jgi:Asp-tRNA(Asn)/Glu-tRNA(Gln) amidotransferase C subunit
VGVPVHPTWSVDKLLSTYSKPVITPSTLKHLHELSALIPPDEGTEAHARLTSEMENLVKLVEAVKLVNVDTDSHVIPDGRIWAEGAGIDLSEDIVEGVEDEINGRELLRYAQRTSSEGLYLVDSDRPK